jgi:hypothetical protein
MKTYRICAWESGATLDTATTLREARSKVRALLGVTRAVRQNTDIPGSIPHGAREGWHASRREDCASLLIY